MKNLPALSIPKVRALPTTEDEEPSVTLPKTTPVTQVRETDARRFERSERAGEPVAKGGSRLKRASLGERVTVYLPPKLVAQIRRRCVNERRSLSDAMTEAATAWMSAGKKASHDD